MKTTLEFNLPEETYEHLQAIHTYKAWQTLSNLDYKLRNIVKHGHNYKCIEDLAKELRNEINEALCLIDV